MDLGAYPLACYVFETKACTQCFGCRWRRSLNRCCTCNALRFMPLCHIVITLCCLFLRLPTHSVLKLVSRLSFESICRTFAPYLCLAWLKVDLTFLVYCVCCCWNSPGCYWLVSASSAPISFISTRHCESMLCALGPAVVYSWSLPLALAFAPCSPAASSSGPTRSATLWSLCIFFVL